MVIDGTTLLVVGVIIAVVVVSRKEDIVMGCGTFVVLVLIVGMILATMMGGQSFSTGVGLGRHVPSEDIGR